MGKDKLSKRSPIYPTDKVKALTIHSGYVWMILNGHKDCEFRRTLKTLPQYLILHTAKTDNSGVYEDYNVNRQNRLPCGAIVGICEIEETEYVEDEGYYHWIGKRIKLQEPFEDIPGIIKPWTPETFQAKKPHLVPKVTKAFNTAWKAWIS